MGSETPVSENVQTPIQSAQIPRPRIDFSKPTEWRSAARTAYISYLRRLILLDFGTVIVANMVAAMLRFPDQARGHHLGYFLPLLTGTWMLALTLRSSYDREHIQKRAQQFRDVVGASFIAFSVVASFSYILKSQFSRGFLLYALTFTVLLLALSRWVLWVRFHKAKGFDLLHHRTLTFRSESQTGVPNQITGERLVTISAPQHDNYEAWLNQVVDTVESQHIDVVVLPRNHNLTDAQLSQLSWILEGSVDIAKEVAIGDLGRRAFLQTTDAGTFLHLREIGLTGPQAVVKRVYDITTSVIALLVLSPIFIITAVAVRTTSRGPALYVQRRIGRHGRLISFPKFRSMRVGADAERAAVLGTPDAEMFTRYRNDPRITAVGRIIRRLSIDELPQLWSVLKGDMSIVGPRPILEEEIQLLNNADHRRLAAKPGLTGIWQISGRKEVPWEQRMTMDIEYLNKWSILGDFLITLRTVSAIFGGRGAV